MKRRPQPIRLHSWKGGLVAKRRFRFLQHLSAPIVATLAVWLLFSWPLPRWVLSGIPYTAHAAGATAERMVPGDHLQLLYHFWLFQDMVDGHTPWFHNLYEFNTGNDDATYRPSPYYLPFSALYTVAYWIGGRAFGWNFAGFVALWAGYWLTWRLARRYGADRWTAAVAALPALILPFRWDALLGGSPMGFAIMWVPAVLLGLDLAVRDGRWTGGLLAGIAILFASFGDTHVFFFSVLATPVWCVIAFLAREDFRWGNARDYGRIALALLPLAVLAAAAYALRTSANRELAASAMGAGRDLKEVLNCSPFPRELVSWSLGPAGKTIYVGWLLPGVLAAGWLAMLVRLFRQRPLPWRPAVVLGLCLLGVFTVALLALGLRAPLKARLFLALREWIPPYAMIRQPAKILCLLPPLLAVGSALALGALTRVIRTRWWAPALLAVVAVAVVADYRARLRPGVCRLEKAQLAYEAVAVDAAKNDTPARALIVALWPGDSHYASIYQYYVSLYRIRMVNGYSPVVPREYFNSIFRRFESANQGYLAEDQLRELTARGVGYVVLHEDLFPEKVSPFPIAFTLKNLLNNPRLQLLAQDGAVWAFKLLPQPEARPEAGADWTVSFPARRWEAEGCRHPGADVANEPAASARRYVRLDRPEARLESPTNAVAPTPGLRYMLRVRGDGALAPALLSEAGSNQPLPAVAVSAPDWTWVDVQVPAAGAFTRASLQLSCPRGAVDADSLLLTAGSWNWDPKPGTSIEIPAPCFFHAGYTVLTNDTVFFRAGDRGGSVLYGPKLPLAAGNYEVKFAFSSAAAQGTEIGRLFFIRGENQDIGQIPVIAGRPATYGLAKTDNLPIHLVFFYLDQRGDVAVEKATVTRLASGPSGSPPAASQERVP